LEAGKRTENMTDEVMEIVKVFEIAARELRRLGRGPLKTGHSSLSSREIYRFGNQIRIAYSFPHDVCFETANKLEELARKLEVLVRPEPFQS
jgi:hypothetical protein